MPILPLNLPPGMFRNGTPYTRKGRWEDGSLVRWHDGSLRPIGGWQRRTDNSSFVLSPLSGTPSTEVVRDIFAWRSLAQSANFLFGSNTSLYHLDNVGTVTDVTPAGAQTSGKDSVVQAGYGQNPYGAGAYGVANNLAGSDPIPPLRWAFANFGEVAIFLQRNANLGPLFELDLGILTTSSVTNAPTGGQAVTVTDQRQVMLIGGGGVPRRLQMSDVEDRTDWTPVEANQAVDRVIAGTGRLLNVVNVLRQSLIIGENDAFAVEYIGPPYVVSVELVGENCGLLATEAIANTDRFAVWWGDRNFWLYDGTVQVLTCDVIDFLYDDIELSQVGKIVAMTRADFTEIWWLYQSNSSTTGEVDSYVYWDYRDNTWTTGRLDRTAGIDKGTALDPIMVDSQSAIYNHELQSVLPDGEVFAETGPIDLQNGEKNVAVRYIYPDHDTPDDVTYTLFGRQFPNAGENTFGPYAQRNPTPTRAIGRSIRMRVDLLNAMSEVGIVRMDVTNFGTGRR